MKDGNGNRIIGLCVSSCTNVFGHCTDYNSCRLGTYESRGIRLFN